VSAEVVGALDIGGTHVTAGRVKLASASVEARVRVPLAPRGTHGELVTAIREAAKTALDVEHVGVAVAGPFDYARGVGTISHKLTGLYGVDLRRELTDAFGLSEPDAIAFLNDADAFLLGESWAGAARGHARAVGVTLGTGLGSAFIERDQIVHSGPLVPPDGALWTLSFRGAPVEEWISRRALLRRYGSDSGTELDVEQVAERARAGDEKARRVFDAFAADLAEFLTPWLRSFAPSCLVVGGSIARAWDLLEPGLHKALAPVEQVVAVVVAANIDDAPLLGAARHAAAERN
jgi:glucokinase